MILKFNYKLQSQIKVEFNYKANSIYSRIQPIVAKSKMVKVKSQRKSKTHQSAGLLHFTTLKSRDPVGFQGGSVWAHGMGLYEWVLRTGKLEAGSWEASWKLRAASWELGRTASCKPQAGRKANGELGTSCELNVKSTLKKMYVQLK